jgi:pimeloyl-ACP methyl ester carboxylesterase
MRRLCLFLLAVMSVEAADIEDRVKHNYADSNGVKIHYVSVGTGPLIVMIHGFPDFWYTWRKQMEVLSESYTCVAIDQRGYNLSDKPKGAENYRLDLLAGDVAAVIRATGHDKAIIVGHDWGGMVAWTFAMSKPQMTDKLIILNLPHPRGLIRELANNPQQQKNSQYARDFQKPDAASKLTAEGLAGFVADAESHAKYVEAFRRSDFEAMLDYYKVNYPREPYVDQPGPLVKVKAPVLMFHGLKDSALLASALNETWEWVEKDLTIVTVPNAGHWVQKDAADLVSRNMKAWLSIH